MNYRQLGNSGVRVSVIGLGANRFGSENVPQTEVNRIIAAALDLGINFIDTSNNYTAGHSEETLGHAVGAAAGLLGDHRRDESGAGFEQYRWGQLGSYGGRVRRSERHSKGKQRGLAVKTLLHLSE